MEWGQHFDAYNAVICWSRAKDYMGCNPEDDDVTNNLITEEMRRFQRVAEADLDFLKEPYCNAIYDLDE